MTAEIERKTGEYFAVYEPDTRRRTGFFQSAVLMVRNVRDSRELVWQLFRRDFLAAHRKSFFGVAWIALGPILGMLSWIFMNATGVLQPGEVGMPYPAFVLLGTTFWGLFMSFYSMAADTLKSGQGFIMQVRYPHEALFAKQVLQAAAAFLISLAISLLVLLAFRVVPDWRIVFLPVLILPMLFLGSAVGLAISALGVVAAEVRKFADALLAMLVFFTPIIYSGSAASGAYAGLVRWNPLTYAVAGVRDVVAYGRMESLSAFLWVGGLSFLIFLFAWRFFYISEEKIIEKMV